MTVSLESVVVASKDQLAAEFANETVLLGLERGVYYGLEGIGSRIWQLLDEARPVAEICDTILAEYDVAREACERDLLAFLDELEREGLVDVA